MTDRDRKYACLYGMLLFCRSFTADSIVFQTENDVVSELFCSLSDNVIGSTGTVSVSKNVKKNDTALYVLTVSEQKYREELIYRFHVSSRGIVHRILKENIDNNSIFAFVAGTFLSCGSIAEPIKEYHLEFSVPYKELAEDLLELLISAGFNVKSTERKGNTVIYMKGSEDIEDLITFMGATMSSIELMNIKIYKDVRNKANRIANCDSANIERTLKASGRQIADIEYIMKTEGLDSLVPELRNMAEIRLENPDVSLKELGEMLDKPVGRSGANHRLKKLSEIAEQIREERGDTYDKNG